MPTSTTTRGGTTTVTTDTATTDGIIPAPRTTVDTAVQQRNRPRVWLVAGLGAERAPGDWPVVRDHQMRVWAPGVDGRWHTPDGRHHATWAELHARFDLVEVTS